MTWIIAHRGASRICPENTLAAFDEALRQGCDGIELDLQLSLDGHPMVYHDRTLFRAGGGRKRLHHLKRKDLRQLDPGKRVAARFRGQRIPTLTEVLRRYGHKTRLLLELKVRGGGVNAVRHRELARATCMEVRRMKLESDVMLLCFDAEILAECRRVAPRIARVRNLRAPRRLTPALHRQLAWLNALSVDIRTLTTEFADAVRKTDTPVLTYTCNTPTRVALALAARVRGVMADRPDWLGARIRAQAGRLEAANVKRRFERLLDGPFDLLVVGGGIYGAWVAYDAAMRGLQVALIDREDWAAGTSMSSSKLIHGGLRYLERLELGLVRKSLAERRLLARLAPHRVTPLRFTIPVFADSRVGKWRLRAGLWLYDRLAGADQPVAGHGVLSRQQMLETYPFLDAGGLKGGLTYGDCQTDDARFTLEIVAGAMHFGAVAVNRVELVELTKKGSRIDGARLRDRETEAEIKVTAGAVINCAGPWVQKVIRTAEPKARQRTRLSKGVHLVMPALATGDAFLKISDDSSGGGVVFLIPWYGRTLLGTTDTDYKGAPGFARAEHLDVTYLLDQANRMLGDTRWEERDIVGTFAGLRTLPLGGHRAPSKVSREWIAVEPVEGLLTSVGGKFTSARADAALAVDRALSMLKRDPLPCPTAEQPFPWAPRNEDFGDWYGAAISRGIGLGLDEATAESCAMRYGVRVEGLFDLLRDDATLTQRILPVAPFCMGEVDHAVQNEMARTLLDVVRRRLPLVLVQPVDVDTMKRITGRIGTLLNWDTARRLAEFETVGACMRPAESSRAASGTPQSPQSRG